MNEIWKDLIGFEDRYEVSSLGRIKSKYRNIFRKPVLNNKGYCKIVLVVNGKYSPKFIHRLVLETFTIVSNLHINHINGNKKDNRLSNLEYVTHRENVNHRELKIRKKKKYGIYFNKIEKTWVTEIWFKGKKNYIGRFKDKEEAYQAFYNSYISFHGVTPW